MIAEKDLPPLPEPISYMFNRATQRHEPVYTADQMREHARAALSMQDAGEGWVLVPRKAWESVEFVHGSFVKYEAQGPRSKNRQFAIRILGNAIESVDAMLAAAPSRPAARQPSGEEWQPIETAPKDGARILLGRDAGAVESGWPEEVAAGYFAARWSEWLTVGGGSMTNPTHWQPLPAPPLYTLDDAGEK